MPTYVDPSACNACAGVHGGPQCVYICPNDLMVLDGMVNKGSNQEPDMCSECYACVKLCPENAIHVRGYADFVPLGAEVQPHYEGTGYRLGRYVPRRTHGALQVRFPLDAVGEHRPLRHGGSGGRGRPAYPGALRRTPLPDVAGGWRVAVSATRSNRLRKTSHESSRIWSGVGEGRGMG